MEHFDTIHDSPSQIYHSALPFCPVSSWLCEQYSTELSNDVKVVKGLPIEWGKCSRTVTLDCEPWCLSYLNNTAAVGLGSGEIVLLNVVTGSCVAVLSGHSDGICSVAFSSDGEWLVSGSSDGTIKLWDIQTGGMVRTLSGHSSEVQSVSISTESALIASGSQDKTIRLWDIETGECQYVIEEESGVRHVSISPIKPYNLISISKKVREWDIHGNQVGEALNGSKIAVSLDGTKFALYNKGLVTVQNSLTRNIIAEFHIAEKPFRCCCFSTDSRLVAAATVKNIYVWDITSSEPHQIETLKEPTDPDSPLVFFSPSSLISALLDRSVKFWQIHLSMDQAGTHMIPKPQSLVEFSHLTLQAKHGVTITGDEDGIVKIWDISTGLCKETIQTPAKYFSTMESRLVDDGLLIVWDVRGPGIHIWDTKEKKTILADTEYFQYRLSEDGSKLFYSVRGGVIVWSMHTGQVVGKLRLDHNEIPSLHHIDGCRIWTSSKKRVQGWEFSTPGSPAVQLPNVLPRKLHPCGVVLWDTQLFRVQDVVTGKVLFQLGKGFKKALDVQWNKQYLVACFGPTDLLILDFGYLIPS